MKLIINIDGASRGNPGLASCGVVIKNSAGKVLLEKGEFLGKATNNFAEFKALDVALTEALKLGATELEIFADSLLLVKQFNREYKIKKDTLKVLMAEIFEKSKNFKQVKLSHIRREKNAEPDAVANQVLDKAELDIKNGKKPMPKKTGQGSLF